MPTHHDHSAPADREALLRCLRTMQAYCEEALKRVNSLHMHQLCRLYDEPRRQEASAR